MSTQAKPVVTLQLKDKGQVKIELYPDIAPNTVNNFLSLVGKGFYDGLTFHRVILGFMVQGGDPKGIGIGGPGYSIRGEFAQNGFENKLKHKRGVISMARSAHPDSAGSQFFIMVEDAPHLDGAYAAFGKVIEGMDHVDAVARAEKDRNDKPLVDQIIEKAQFDLMGYELVEPEIIK
ncbi:MAG: peptidylprolyl isomerase [Clostridiales bacterium]|jgi:peptidyl-prolyl cis-trans isomerase B (cyclophilin B)|nr:peptidylprolyl isomerase [Clostridia bacterium]MDI9513285.1 peptidylprolyl isomerase [Bacillota bacterium]NLH58737.1 peptidylprolyl isomerase [Clostridiales bacterium]